MSSGTSVVDPGAPVRLRGAGCLEAVASAAAVERAYAAAAASPPGPVEVGADVVAALWTGRPCTQQAVMGHAVGALATALIVAVTLTGFDLVLVGEAWAESGEVLLAPLRPRSRATDLPAECRDRAAALGERAGCLGAACLAWDLT